MLSLESASGEPEAWLGLLNGALIGLALALGAWGLGLFAGGGASSSLWYGSLLLGVVAAILLAGLSGWLAALVGKAFFSLLIWSAAGLAVTWAVGHSAYEGSTLVAWLLDRRFWGLPIYPYIPAALVRQVMAGFFIVLLLAILGLLQPYRLEGVSGALTAARRLSGQAWFLLLLPLPLVFGAGLIADNLVNQPLRSSVAVVDEVFRTGRTYQGDLFQFSLEQGVNYSAIAGVRDRMSPDYTLSIGEIELGVSATVFVAAHFDNGAWVNCRVVAEQLSYCWDASPPYERGLPALLAGQTLKDCPECTVVTDAAARTSLAAQTLFSELPQVRRLAQQGSYVWMRAESPAGDQGVDCLLRDISPVRLVACRAVSLTAGSAIAPTRRNWSRGFSRSGALREKLAEALSLSRSNLSCSQGVCDPRPPVTDRLEAHNWDLLTPTPQRLFSSTQEGIGPRSGRAPGLMALAPPEKTPDPPSGMAPPEPSPSDGPLGMATPDRLAAPPTVYPPAQADLGAQVYWFKCMVCHGDQGQGLTDEWRSAWDPSHQNCWQSRCHAASHPPEGFQLPNYAPPVIGPGTLARHTTLADLHNYLAAQMPWQAPGSLPAEEYWQLAAYLARTNGAAVSDADLNPDAAARVLLHPPEVSAAAEESETKSNSWPIAAGVALSLVVGGLGLGMWYRRRRRIAAALCSKTGVADPLRAKS